MWCLLVNFLSERMHQNSLLKRQWKYPNSWQPEHCRASIYRSCVKHWRGAAGIKRLVTQALPQGLYGSLVKMVAGLFGASAVGQAGR